MELLLHESVDETTHMQIGRPSVAVEGSLFFFTLCVNREVLLRACEHAWALLCYLTEVLMTRWLQQVWGINHNC